MQDYGDFGFSIPSGDTIEGIQVRLESGVESSSSEYDIRLELSKDNGSTWVASKDTMSYDFDTSNTDYFLVFGHARSLWDTTWSPSDFDNANFRIRIGITNTSGFDFHQLDHVSVKVFHGAGSGGGSTTSSAQYIHTDHLGGSSVATDENGDIIQLLDYYPYGDLRIDQTTTFDEQRKFTGHELDNETGLTYANSRYYNQAIGRFLSQDSAFLAVGTPNLQQITGLELQAYLSNPQGLNAYSYTANNPVKHIDVSGEWFVDFFGGRQSFSNLVLEVGDAAQTLYNTSSIARTAFDNPIAASAVIGAGGGLAAAGGAAAFTGLSTSYLGGAGTACIAFCGQAVQQGQRLVDYTAGYGQNLGSRMSQAHRTFQKAGLNFHPHLVEQTVLRTNRGVTPEKVINTVKTGTKYFDNAYNNYSYFKNGIRVAQELSGQLKTVVTQNSVNAERFTKITE